MLLQVLRWDADPIWPAPPLHALRLRLLRSAVCSAVLAPGSTRGRQP